MSDFKNIYNEASIRVREQMALKVTVPLSKNVRDDAKNFVKLTNEIQLWKTYLTEKQLEVVDLYLKVLSSSEVDHQMKLTTGTCYHRLFGSMARGDRGVYGALLRVRKMLQKNANEKKKAVDGS